MVGIGKIYLRVSTRQHGVTLHYIFVKRLMANPFDSAMVLLGSLQSRQTTLKALNLSISGSALIRSGVQEAVLNYFKTAFLFSVNELSKDPIKTLT